MVATMKALKLHGMAQAIAELAAQRGPAFVQAKPVLDDLLMAEVAEREVRSINYQMKIARFPAYRDLAASSAVVASSSSGFSIRSWMPAMPM